MPKLKQATISSLKGVVIVEDFVRHKSLLDNPDASEENLLSTLSDLKKKKPCLEVIRKYRIDTSLQALCDDKRPNICEAAKALYEFWELDGSCKRQPTIEVRYDKQTRHIRRTAIRLIRDALGGTEEDESKGEILEREVFYKNDRRISKTYRRTIRKAVFAIHHHESKCGELKSGEVTPKQFISKYLQ